MTHIPNLMYTHIGGGLRAPVHDGCHVIRPSRLVLRIIASQINLLTTGPAPRTRLLAGNRGVPQMRLVFEGPPVPSRGEGRQGGQCVGRGEAAKRDLSKGFNIRQKVQQKIDDGRNRCKLATPSVSSSGGAAAAAAAATAAATPSPCHSSEA